MDTIKILLAATIALLIGAFGWNWLEQREQVKNSPASELARIQKQLAEIKREEQNLIAEKQLRDMGVLDMATYTQLQAADAMREAAAPLAAMLSDPQTHFYVCGLKSMEEGVVLALHDVATQAGLDWEALGSTLKKEGRLHLETY